MSASLEKSSMVENNNHKRLPVISETRSLVSPTQAPKPLLKRQASQWAIEVRQRLDTSIALGQGINEYDLAQLRQEIVALFITALQQDSHSAWMFLTDALNLLVPYKKYLGKVQEITHYLERIHQHVQMHKERLFDVQVIDALAKVFPQQLEDIKRHAKTIRNYCSPVPPRPIEGAISPRGSPKKVPQKLVLPNGQNPYTLEREDDVSKSVAQSLTFADLSKSLPAVAVEISAREAIWSHSAGLTALSMNVELQEEEKATAAANAAVRRQSSRSEDEAPSKESKKVTEKVLVIEAEGEAQSKAPMTGREAVEYFTRMYHTGKIESIFFNIAPNRHYKPYDLISVPKNKANSEHFVFSTFGVLHVYGNQPSENMTLAEWHREAVLYTAVTKIPFFKYFLVRKAFKMWYANKTFKDFSCIRKKVADSMLQCIPGFGTALLQIAKLLQELSTVKFLPYETDKCYMLSEFENIVNYKNIQAERLLERFFKYCKLIVDTTKEDCFKRLHYCEQQVKHKTVFTKDSLHLQRLKKEQREENLKKAKDETSRLGNFVKLIDQAILARLVEVAKINVSTFVQDTMKIGREAPRSGLFLANLVFNKKDVLAMSPSKEKFIRSLTKVQQEIPYILIDSAVQMDEMETHGGGDGESIEEGSTVKTTSHFGGKAKKGLGEDEGLINSPRIQRAETPSKRDDMLGVATPDLVIRPETKPTETLMVEGEGIVGQYNPLTRGNLEEKLGNDEEYNAAIQLHLELLQQALVEIDEYCAENSWLNDIYQFCKSWNDQSLQEWKGAPAFNIEQKLTEIRNWTERIKVFDKSFTTENGIFHVDCSAMQRDLIPKLNGIYKEMVTFVAEEASDHGKKFVSEMKTILQNMKDKKTTIDGFAVYAKQISQYKKNSASYQHRVEYIKSLFEVIRMSYRHLNQEEEKIEENVWAAWEAFLFQMQDATEFVNMQTPLMLQNLEDTFQQLEQEALRLHQDATTGKFLNPDENPTKILIEMRRLRERFYEVNDKLNKCSKWREMITGQTYKLDFLTQLSIDMDIRQELWKYVEVSNHAIRDWKQQIFRKMNVQKAFDKVQEWQAVAFQMKNHLPPSDQVLATWFKALQDFKQDMPLLHKLASDALKPRHWKEIFVGMGEEYEPAWQFTVADLLAYNLGEHSSLINTVYAGAKSEFALEQKLVKLRKLWLEKEFKLAKHIPDSVYEKDTLAPANSNDSAHPGKRVRGLAKFRQDKALANQAKGLNVASDDMYVLIEVEELKYLMQDSQVTLQSMLVSPYLADLRAETEYWSNALHQAEEIIDLWMITQKKWLYLLKIFEDPEVYKKLSAQSVRFEGVNSRYKEFIRSVLTDPKVTSIFPRQRSERGYRKLQGDVLRDLLVLLIGEQERIIKHLETLLEQARSEFPRLYFLSNQEVVALLGISRNPPTLLPYVKKCFPGIKGLKFALPSQASAISSALDYALNAHKLQVTTLEGELEESVPLVSKVVANNQATKWLSTLEEGMKVTMATMLQACVQARLDDSSKKPLQLLEELTKFEAKQRLQERALEEEKQRAKDKSKTKGSKSKEGELEKIKESTQEIGQEIRHTFSHWLLRFPFQCVLTAEAVIWHRGVIKAMDTQDITALKEIRDTLNNRIEQYITILKDNPDTSETRKRLHRLLSALVNQNMYQRDTINTLLKIPNIQEDTFEWVRVLRYHMDFKTVLRAKTEFPESTANSLASGGSDRRKSVERRPSMPERKSSFTKPKESPSPLQRSKTTVSVSYQFTPCTLHQLGGTFLYDHEYLGPSPRLVFTPLTERAYLMLTMSLRTFNCGTLIGPAATGKSETVKDLAKAMGRHCVVTNCNSELTLPIMNQFLSGVVQSGCWMLFDDTDRLTRGLMSVFAQQLEYLRNAVRVLDTSTTSQYRIRGQPKHDKKQTMQAMKHVGERIVRRNSLTTLHSLLTPDAVNLERQKTVPHGYNEDGLGTYFEDTWVPHRERERRHSIEREVEIKVSELYKSNKPLPLFYDQANYKPYKSKADYKELLSEPIHKSIYLGHVLFNGKLVRANSNFGCFMTINSQSGAYHDMPENMKLQMRPCAIVLPDVEMILEMTLCCNGVIDYKKMARKLKLFFDLLKTQLPRKPQYNFSLRTIKTVVEIAVQRLHGKKHLFEDVSSDTPSTDTVFEDNSAKQEFAIVYAINMCLVPKMDGADDVKLLKSLTRDVFPHSVRPKSGVLGYDPELVSQVQEQMSMDNLQATPEHVNKILQLYSALKQNRGVLLVGPSGSGKTTCYQTLARAMNILHGKPPEADKEEGEALKGGLEGSISQHSNKKLKILEQNKPRQEAKVMSKFRRISKGAAGMSGGLGGLLKDINKAKRISYPKVDMLTLFPNAYTPEELFGHFQEGLWQDGLLSKMIRDSLFQVISAKVYKSTFDEKKSKGLVEPPDVVERWVVLDGSINPAWVEHMNTMLDTERTLTLANGEKIFLKDATSLVFEMSDLTNASPATITRCEVVHCSNETVKWPSIVESWCNAAKQKWIVSTKGLEILNDLISGTFANTLKFLTSDCQSSLTTDIHRGSLTNNNIVPGQAEVFSFLRILGSVFNRFFLREDFENTTQDGEKSEKDRVSPLKLVTPERPETTSGLTLSRMTGSSRYEDHIPNYKNIIKSMFAFAYIWGFGGHLHERHISKFNKFARETLYKCKYPINVPISGLVFDYCLDVNQGSLIKWSDRPTEKIRNLPAHYVITPEVDRYHYLVDLLLNAQQPVLLTGVPGVGKTSLIQNVIQQKHPYSRLNMSPGLTSDQFQNMVANYILELKKYNIVATHAANQTQVKPRHLFFVDDLNAAANDNVTGTQPTLEVLRQILCQRSAYDRSRHVAMDLSGAEFLAACTGPGNAGSGGGLALHNLSGRLTRLFTVLTFFTPTAEGMHTLYAKTIQSWLEEFPTYSVEHHHEFANAITQGVLDLYNLVKDKLRPTPANAHYIFTLRDIARIMEGILMMSPRSRARPKPKARRRKESKESLALRSKLGITLPALDKAPHKSKTWGVNKEAAGGAPPMMRVIARLWCHECTRTFGDRILSEDDNLWFRKIIHDLVQKHFCTGKAEWREQMYAIKEETGSQVTGQFTRSSPIKRMSPLPYLKSDSATPDEFPPSTASTMTITSTDVTEPFSDMQSTTIEPVTPLSQGGFTEATTEVVTPFSTEMDLQSMYQQSLYGPVRAPPPSEDPGQSSTGSSETESTETASSTEETSSDEDSNTEAETSTSGLKSKMTDTEGGTTTVMTDLSRLNSRTSTFGSSLFTESIEGSIQNPSQASNLKPPTPSLKKGPARKEVKRGVTFKTGLIVDRDMEAYEGPLLSMDQIKLPHEDLTEIYFTRYIMTTYTEAMGLQAEKGYVECSSEVLDDALQMCLALYNSGTSQKLDLVFFTEAIQHIARLSRVLALPGGHSLQLGVGYCTGRSTMARLGAYIAHCKLFEPKKQSDPTRNRDVLHEHLRRCSTTAAITPGKPVVLLVHEDLGDECLQDICSFMAEGTCPNLYTAEDIQQIATQMTPGQVQMKRLDKIEPAFEKFLKRVKQQMHVVICMDYNHKGNGSSLQHKLMKFPTLLNQAASVDLYKQWTQEACVKVAETWLREENAKISVPWSDRQYDQIKAVSSAMAYIHHSSKTAIEDLYSHQKEVLKFFTPLTYMEFVHIFKVVAASIAKKETALIEKYQSGLNKMNEAFDKISQYKDQLADLRPKYKSAQDTVDEHVRKVEEQKQEFVDARDRCKEQEEKISKLMGPLEELRKDAEAEFAKVNPTYYAALNALQSLSIHDVEEIKSYKKPPQAVIDVVKVLCMLFRKPQDWENGKMLLISDTFFKDLEFYDKDHIPEDIFLQLRRFVRDPNFQPIKIQQSSLAAASICQWVHAVYEYGLIHRTMQPKLRALVEAEDELNQAQAILGQKRVEANRIKAELEGRIKAHKEAVRRAKVIDKEIRDVEDKIYTATNLMDNMAMQHKLWQTQLKTSKNKLKTCPGDSLLTAACVCYHGPFDSSTRTELLNDWLGRCQVGNFDLKLKIGNRRRKLNTLSAKLENLIASKAMSSISESSFHKPETTKISFKHVDEEGSTISSLAVSDGKLSPPKEHLMVFETSSVLHTDTKIVLNSSIDEFDPLLHGGKHKGLVTIRKNYSLQDVLSTFEELSDWKTKDLTTNLTAIQNALIMRVCCHNHKHCWPLLIDPDGQAEIWVRALQESKNVIHEKDVMDLETNVGDGVEKSTNDDYSQSDHIPPPSRGTAVTYSDIVDDGRDDVSEMSLGDDGDSQTDSRTHTSVSGFQSRMTATSDLRPVTSVTNSLEDVRLDFEDLDLYDRPDNNLWIIPADDPQMDSKLISSVVHGITVLITHLERKPLDPLFRALLLKQYTVDREGNKIMRVGEMQFRYHQDFCLYLSTSAPLFFKGDGMYDLPIQKVSVINMAFSQDCVVDRLLTEIMKFERTEFEGQRRSIEADILQHKHDLNKEQETVLAKTLDLYCPLLDDGSMLDTLITCQKNVLQSQESLEETNYLRDNLEEKRTPYIQLATHAAMLYDIINMMSVLCPLYHLSFSYFVKLFSETLESRQRGKLSQGAPKARAEELVNATTSKIYQHISVMMYEQHTQLFALLVTMERMRSSGQLTPEELGLFVDGLDTSDMADTIVLDYKPKWIADKTWMECTLLENTLPVFKGLRSALAKLSSQWEEYFKLPVSLTTMVPGNSHKHLTVFQKCLLWRVCAPERVSEVADALILYELGGIIVPPDHFNINDVYTTSKKQMPVIFLLPSCDSHGVITDSTQGYFIDPVFHINQLAREVGHEGRVHTISLGVHSQMVAAQFAIQECMKSGYWLILQNCHLAEPWTQEMLELIKVILKSKDRPATKPLELEDPDTDPVPPLTRPSTVSEDSVHPNFRLWMTTRVDSGRLIPGLLIQHGRKVSCERTGNFRSTLYQSNKHVRNMISRWEGENTKLLSSRDEYLLPLVLLHAILLQRRTYGQNGFIWPATWTYGDLSTSLDVWKIITMLCDGQNGISSVVKDIYSGHCLDPQDSQAVQALANALVLSDFEIKKLPISPPGVSKILQYFSQSDEKSFYTKLEQLLDVDATTVGLVAKADLELYAGRSRNLLQDLSEVSGAPEMCRNLGNINQKEMWSRLETMLNILKEYPELPKTSSDQLYPLELFFHYEVENYRKLVSNLESDITLLQKAVRGEAALSPLLQEMLTAISKDGVPPCWFDPTFPVCKTVMVWLNDLKVAMELLSSYVSEGDKPAVYNLSAFLRPDRFLQTVLQTHARKQFRDLQLYKLQVQVMPVGITPSSPPESGVYVSGLHLHNASWDRLRSVIIEQPVDSQDPTQIPVVWFKPTDISLPSMRDEMMKYHLYDCPLYLSKHSALLDSKNIVTRVELPTVQKTQLWDQMRVFLSSSLPENT